MHDNETRLKPVIWNTLSTKTPYVAWLCGTDDDDIQFELFVCN